MHTEALWAINPQNLKGLMELKPGSEDYGRQVHMLTHDAGLDYDMTSYGWVKVGTVRHHYSLELSDKLMQEALAAIDMAEKKLTDEYMEKLNALKQARQEFLALPAPKAQDADISF